jgi:putative amide transporter protein
LALIFGAIASVRFSFQDMTALDLIIILVLLFGGVGLVLRSVRESS